MKVWNLVLCWEEGVFPRLLKPEERGGLFFISIVF